jgi:tetrahydromethanopterin S-methyltransferase subunit F
MGEIPEGKWTEDMNSLTEDVHNQFDLIDEIGRGALYRGGEDADTFMSGYAVGFLGGLLLLIVLFVTGSLTG